jgi:hypothetical protein
MYDGTSLLPPRESLVSDIPAGDWNIEKLFLQCNLSFQQSSINSYLLLTLSFTIDFEYLLNCN